MFIKPCYLHLTVSELLIETGGTLQLLLLLQFTMVSISLQNNAALFSLGEISLKLLESLFSPCLLRKYVARTNLYGVGAHIALPQALHPFYVFQIASIILWSIDDYWYYGTLKFGDQSINQHLIVQLLSHLYRNHLCVKHYYYTGGNEEGMALVISTCEAVTLYALSPRPLSECEKCRDFLALCEFFQTEHVRTFIMSKFWCHC